MKPKPCGFVKSDGDVCGSLYHSAWHHKPRTALRQRSKKTEQKDIDFKIAWFAANPPDQNGEWECYLQIASDCLIVVDFSTLRREHVKSRARHPELKYELSNVRTACDQCNELKGSLDLEDLVKVFPHLQKYL